MIFPRLLCLTGLMVASALEVRAVVVASVLSAVSDSSKSSLALVDGFPAVAWSDSGTKTINYRRALNVAGTEWGAPVTLDSGNVMGADVSLRIVNGNPAVCYADHTAVRLKFIRASDSTGTVWPAPLLLNAGGPASQVMMEVIGGNPAIMSRHGSAALYMRASDANGTAWVRGAGITENPSLYDAALTDLNGRPAIAFATQMELWYARALDAEGRFWWAPQKVAEAPIAFSCCLKVVNGAPAISYFTAANNGLTYVRATDAEGTVWGAPVPLNSGSVSLTGNQTSLAVVNGRPAIAYMASLPWSQLKLLQANDAFGDTPAAWGPPLVLENSANTGHFPSLLEVSGNPALTYFTVTPQGSLKFLRATDASGGALWPADIWVQVNDDEHTNIPDGGTAGFGVVPAGTVKNLSLKFISASPASGSINTLNLTIDGPDAAAFSVVTPPATPVAAGAGADFVLRYAPLTPGAKTAALHITGDVEFASGSFDFMLTGEPPSTTALDSWRLQYFGTPDNTGDAADDADPDNDGLTNFTEFAFGLNPADGTSNALPEFKYTGNSMTATFTAPPGREESVVYRPRWSSNLQSGAWEDIPDTGTAPGHTFHVPAAGSRVFMRWELSLRP